MQRRFFVLVSVMSVSLIALPVISAIKPLELFGIPLKGATRDQLRQAFKQNNLRPTREDNQYWVDTYNAEGVLEGASEFKSGYTIAGKFAFAQYTFPGFVDTELVGKVINMVSTKYGRPSSKRGDYGLGEVTAKWDMGQGMLIEVSRGWPDTTTELTFIDLASNSQMNAEMNAAKKAQTQQQVKTQSKAF